MTNEELQARHDIEAALQRRELLEVNTGGVGLDGLPPETLAKLKQVTLDEYKKAVRNYAKIVSKLKA